MEMLVNGVSTLKVENITEELCGEKFSKSTVSNLCKNLDTLVEAFKNRPLETHYPFVIVGALYIKTRIEGRVQSRGLLIAVGINGNGNRKVIGFTIANTESEISWGDFFESLKERGLKNVHMVTSDDHKEFLKAIKKHFQTASWQRYQTHFSRNMLDKTPKKL